MPVTLPIEAYEVFESNFGKESAHKLVKALESTISDSVEYKWKITKDELLDAIRKEFVTRELFEERFNVIEERFKSLNFKLNIFIAIALIALTFANPTFVKLIERLF
ncbi:MAG: hypothetical protein HY097_00550 [Nitrospinae bacterium]|nr:hypothetical protein [Nitrospinota bacterium]